jgi:hypothetical protein
LLKGFSRNTKRLPANMIKILEELIASKWTFKLMKQNLEYKNIFQSLMQLNLNFDKSWTKWKNTTAFENATNHRYFAAIY